MKLEEEGTAKVNRTKVEKKMTESTVVMNPALSKRQQSEVHFLPCDPGYDLQSSLSGHYFDIVLLKHVERRGGPGHPKGSV